MILYRLKGRGLITKGMTKMPIAKKSKAKFTPAKQFRFSDRAYIMLAVEEVSSTLPDRPDRVHIVGRYYEGAPTRQQMDEDARQYAKKYGYNFKSIALMSVSGIFEMPKIVEEYEDDSDDDDDEDIKF